jgi:hypothetical protein
LGGFGAIVNYLSRRNPTMTQPTTNNRLSYRKLCSKLLHGHVMSEETRKIQAEARAALLEDDNGGPTDEEIDELAEENSLDLTMRDNLRLFARQLLENWSGSSTRTDILIHEYNKELFGEDYESGLRGGITIETLIEQSREYRKNNKNMSEITRKAAKEAYDFSYQRAIANVQENTILLSDLRKMTTQELANLIGCDDY